MNTPRQKSELLTNIEMLWHDAEHSGDDQAKSTFQRISELMQDAMATDLVANDAVPVASPHAIIAENVEPAAAGSFAPSTPIPHESSDTSIDELAALVETASQDNAPTADSAVSPSFEEAKARMDSVAQLKPPHQDSYNSGSPEYAFGAAFTDLVRHVVRDYIHNEVEGVIKNAIKSELDHHFQGHNEDDTT